MYQNDTKPETTIDASPGASGTVRGVPSVRGAPSVRGPAGAPTGAPTGAPKQILSLSTLSTRTEGSTVRKGAVEGGVKRFHYD